MAEEAILSYLEKGELISDFGVFASERRIDHNEIVNVIKSLHGFRYLDAEDIKRETWVLTDEGKTYAVSGSPEVQLFMAIPPEEKARPLCLQNRLCSQAVKNKWVDACEDISYDLLPFDDGSIASEQVDNNLVQDGLVNDFFGGIDSILDSIKNGSGLPVVPETGNGNQDSALALQAEISDQKDNVVKNGLAGEKHGRAVEVRERSEAESNAYKVSNGNEEGKTLGDSKENGGVGLSREHHVDGEERFGKRARLGSYKNARLYPGRGNYHPKERCPNRKRPREWDEVDRKEKDTVRRRENFNGCGRRDVRDRDWRDRERGYWDRDKSGFNDMVFRFGTWEADRNREGKVANDIKQECNGKIETKTEVPKERIPEEKAW